MAPHARTPARGTAGFSLVELIVIVAIAIALLAIGYPRMSTLVSKYRLDNTAWDLATHLQSVRQKAIAQAARYQVTFDPGAGTYQVEKESPRASGVWVDDGPVQEVDDAGRVTLTGVSNPIFTSRGTVVAGTEGVITLAGPEGGNRTIGITVPGGIRVQQ